MTTIDQVMPAGALRAPRYLRMLLLEAKLECLKLLRLRAYVLPSLFFPAMFYMLFAVAFGARRSAGAISIGTYMIATFGTFGVMGSALFALGVGVATERGQGWLTVKRASPLPPIVYFLAKVLMSMFFAALNVAILFALGAAFAHVRMAPATWALVATILVVGAAPFCALGCALAFLVGPNSAPAIVNLVYLPMAFTSGLWMPLELLPKFMQAIAPFLPPYHLSRLALGVIDPGSGTGALGHIGALLLSTLIFLAVAVVGYRRDDGKTYG
jgi:ABC-2 type transport system permease protein